MAQEDVILESAIDHQGSQDHDHQQVSDQSQELKAKKLSWQKLRRYDSLDLESRSFTAHHSHASKVSIFISYSCYSFSGLICISVYPTL
ncbi:hypothetical protein GBA52_028264 [Prunus armeniaca]|nr:hypothetical protein GBA52_028264 [Prunus armeniaca]